MMLPKTLLTLVLLAPIASCEAPIGVLHSLLHEDEAVAEPAVLGEWSQTGDGTSTFRFEKAEGRGYKLTMVDPQDNGSNGSAVFDVQLVKLGGYLFMDAQLEQMTVKGESVDADVFWFPVHLFGRIEVVNDKLEMRLLEEGWLKRALEDGRVNLRYEKVGQYGILVTATTDELQEFARKFAADEEAFSYETTLARRKPAAGSR